MRKFLVIITILFASANLFAQKRSVPDVAIDQLLKRIESPSDTIYVVNFWATWCLPCVKEIPEFNKIPDSFRQKPVKVIMANLDFPNQKASRLMPFLEKHTIKGEVVMAITPRGGDWIERVNISWSGAIPATIFLHKGKQSFHEGEIDYQAIEKYINTLF